MTEAFVDRILPAPKNGGFRMEGYWVWCGSVIRGDDGRYHMFASRWPRNLEFGPHWVTNSEIVRAVSDTPEGPYTFAEVVLPPRGEEHWDGRMTHNPTVHRCGDTFLLFYTGVTYSGPTPTPDRPLDMGGKRLTYTEPWRNKRLGLATAPSVEGPWTRRDAPLIEPRPGHWDAIATTNPAPCVAEDGSCLLVYKSISHLDDLLRLGVARAAHYEGPYERPVDAPIFNFDETGDHVEDAYVWRAGDRYELIMKDMKGGPSGEMGAGVHALSEDGLHWRLAEAPKAWSRRVKWDDGSETEQFRVERPQLLIQDGRPTHLFAATISLAPGHPDAQAWNMCFPLKTG